jgi:hypothetical protein
MSFDTAFSSGSWRRTSAYIVAGAFAGICGATLGIGGNGAMGYLRQIPIGTYSKYYNDTTLFIIGEVGVVIGGSFGMRKMYLLSQRNPTNSRFAILGTVLGIVAWAFVMDVAIGIPLPWIIPHGAAEAKEEEMPPKKE